ncbi:VOC family protein [Bacillus sp. V33-4]|uniref:VOC family protein n=1 Tax=Bacillus sp. V33-4 TaxID=2054169 RepID=UPI000C7796B0|nr:VOC family protein [Bacillus sp. V33-4]PLR87089.1 hypothetical protein CVD23_04515 [Bacillus sp. V33-4]
MLNQIGVLTIRVHNLKEAITFYTEALGFEVATHYGEKLVSLKHEGLPLVLEETEGIQANSQNNVLPGLIAKNLDEEIEVLKSKGVKILFEEPKPCPPGRYTIIEDPSGNQIELVEFKN